MPVRNTASEPSPAPYIQDKISLKAKRNDFSATDAVKARPKINPLLSKKEEKEKESGAQSSGVNGYLKLVLLLEKKVKESSISSSELAKVVKNLKDRWDHLSPKNKDPILASKEYKDLKLTSKQTLPEFLLQRLQEKKDLEPIFAFLKSKTFVQSLKGENPPLVYEKKDFLKPTREDKKESAIEKPAESISEEEGKQASSSLELEKTNQGEQNKTNDALNSLVDKAQAS